jgi:hypothetical protein
VALWSLGVMQAIDPNIKEARAIETDGNKWRMITINSEFHFEKTGFYQT